MVLFLFRETTTFGINYSARQFERLEWSDILKSSSASAWYQSLVAKGSVRKAADIKSNLAHIRIEFDQDTIVRSIVFLCLPY